MKLSVKVIYNDNTTDFFTIPAKNGFSLEMHYDVVKDDLASMGKDVDQICVLRIERIKCQFCNTNPAEIEYHFDEPIQLNLFNQEVYAIDICESCLSDVKQAEEYAGVA